ncbi:TonB-dependent receptor [Edaphobacter albus]|uniref:TonB-dependent receptor n=1 Tax=Edaphobacter sp. 4G125 TaxID=2763071 RepID=UPI001648A357|nr:carboxypeptidase-like regulatory domain-containing protein [Edaphobacter sp. 4G125]QNI37187.1 carboxypeptidase regulatory-like domain-containing protein [Edaphobacter sp. 4G125]
MTAQTLNATLRGTAEDNTGAVVAGVEVTLLEPATGQTVRRATTTVSGDFEFNELKPGTYELRGTAKGFRAFVAKNIVLDSGQVRRLDMQFALGQAEEEVTVSAGAAVITTESSTIADLFTAKQHEQSPQVTVYPSTWYQLTTLAGVQGGKYPPVANGEQQSQQSQTFDGIPNDLNGIQNNNANFYEQVAATLFNAPAESAVPVQLSSVTKRGANAFHGKATYRIYSSALNAQGYFDTQKTPYLQHEWDLEASGPIWKDHTFFYGGWFAQRIPLGTSYRTSVPTTAWRNGVFSSTIIDPTTGLPFPNNTIPANRISSVSAAIQNTYYPSPNVATNEPVNNYSYQFPFNSDLYRGDWPIVRVDHNLTKNNSVFVRWQLRQTPYVLSANGIPGIFWTRNRKHSQWAAGDTHIFSPTIVNNFRFGYSTDNIVDGDSQGGQTPFDGSKVLTAVGLQGANPSNLTGQGFPTINITGLTSLSNVSGGTKGDNHILTLNDAVDWQRGKHSWKFGGSFMHYRNFYGVVPNYGTFAFDGSITGKGLNPTADNAYADFLLGLPQNSQRVNPLGNREMTLNEYGIYAEDSFKVTRKLTLNYGVRWDLYGTPSAGDHLAYNWDPSTGNVIVDSKGIGKVSPLYPSNITVVPGQVQAIMDKSNIAPRIGAAYSITDHSVIRGGYGIYTSRFDDGSGNFNNFLPINPQLGSTGPFAISESYQNAITNGAPLLSFPNPYPSSTASSKAPGQSVNGYERGISHGRIHQFSVSYEHEIARIGLRASYLGSRSTGLNYSVNVDLPRPGTIPFSSTGTDPKGNPCNPPNQQPICITRPFPQFTSAKMLKFDGGAHYDALQLAANRRTGDLTFSGSYSYTHSTVNYLDTENPYDVLSHWTNDGVTRRHYSSVSMVWALPFGKNKRYLTNSGDMVNRAVGGWSTSVATYLASGLWFSPKFDGVDSSNTGTVGGLPDKIGDPTSVPGGKNKNNWFNMAAFAVPQPGHFGNALPNSLEGQRLYQTHVSLSKSTAITERVHFNFVMQVSNLFNHPQFLNPSGDISTQSGNQFTSQYGTFDSLESGQVRQITFLGGFTF